MTLWAMEDDMHATGAISQRLRIASSQAAGGEVHSVEVGEVAVHA